MKFTIAFLATFAVVSALPADTAIEMTPNVALAALTKREPQCCGYSAKCGGAGAACINLNVQKCGGALYSGLCPCGSNCKCCVPP